MTTAKAIRQDLGWSLSSWFSDQFVLIATDQRLNWKAWGNRTGRRRVRADPALRWSRQERVCSLFANLKEASRWSQRRKAAILDHGEAHILSPVILNL